VSVVVSLLRAIDRADGDALVMHVGEKPYVVTASGQAELAANALTVAAMTGMLDQLLPPESRKTLNDLGAVEYHLPVDPSSPGTRYSVVAARGGNDIWIEVRRRKLSEGSVPVAVPHASSVAVEEPPLAPVDVPPPPAADRYADATPPPEQREPREPDAELDQSEEEMLAREREDGAPAEVVASPPAGPIEDPSDSFQLTAQAEDEYFDAAFDDIDSGEVPASFEDLPPAFDFTQPDPPAARHDEEADTIEPAETAPAVPLARVNVRLEPPAPVPPAAAPPVVIRKHADPLHHLLYVAAAHGASALYVAPQAKPSLRVDGEIRVLDEAPLAHDELESGVRSLLQTPDGAPLPIGEIETREVADVGRVQYLGFRDHRGLGAMFRMLPGRAISSEQAGLSAAIQALCTEPEGLLLVAGARSAGKSTLVAALVDQINRTRRDHVITVEHEIQYVHVNRTSFVSQREAREDEGFAEAVRTAMREAPDVLVIDGAMNPSIAAMALHAAADGHMVVASVTAPTTAAALERFVSLLPHEADSRALFGEHLRGVVTQALLRKTGGGRAAAREVLVNVPSTASLVAGAQFDQIPAVLNSGRRLGMVPLNDALLGLVQSGALDVRQAYRKSPEPRELLEMLTRAGFDTSFAETLA
jgi:twitching motility protein PilT